MMMIRRELRLAAFAVLGIWLTEAALLLADSEQGLFPWLRARTQLHHTREELQALLGRRDALAARAQALRSDPRAIEAAAREELGMVFPGELVLQREPEAAERRP